MNKNIQVGAEYVLKASEAFQGLEDGRVLIIGQVVDTCIDRDLLDMYEDIDNGLWIRYISLDRDSHIEYEIPQGVFTDHIVG